MMVFVRHYQRVLQLRLL